MDTWTSMETHSIVKLLFVAWRDLFPLRREKRQLPMNREHRAERSVDDTN